MKKKKLFSLDEKLKKLDDLTNREQNVLKGGGTPPITPIVPITPTPNITFKYVPPPTPPPVTFSVGPGPTTSTGITVKF